MTDREMDYFAELEMQRMRETMLGKEQRAWEPRKARKKPVVIEFYQYKNEFDIPYLRQWIRNELIENENGLYIHTLEGDMCISRGDYVIKGVHGEFYPCKPDIFEKTYDVENERVNDVGKLGSNGGSSPPLSSIEYHCK